MVPVIICDAEKEANTNPRRLRLEPPHLYLSNRIIRSDIYMRVCTRFRFRIMAVRVGSIDTTTPIHAVVVEQWIERPAKTYP